MGPAAAYLAATRREMPAFLARDYYRSIFDGLQTSLSSYGATPEFDLTYSAERTCETIRTGERQIVIYDQYLGQTFNQLNRLHFNATDPHEARIYAYKVAAEFAQIDGQTRLGAVLAMAHVANRDGAIGHRKDTDVAHRMRITALQEAFVMAHEAFHTIVERQAAWREQMLSDARADFLKNFYLSAITRLEKANHPNLDTIAPMYLKQMELFGSDDALVEECLCDTLSMSVICPHPDRSPSIGQVEDARDAIFFALRHLRLLAFVRHAVHERRPGFVANDAWLNPYLVRTQFVQWALGQFPPLRALRTPEMLTRFELAQERYSKFVEDPILFELPTAIAEYANKVYPEAHERELGDALTDTLLQHPEQAQRMSQLGEKFFITDPASMSHEFYDTRSRALQALMDEEKDA